MGEPLIIFVMALAVVTLVGHGIWLALAAVFRAVAGVVDDRPTCPSCLARLPSGKTACGACGWKLEPRTVDERKLGLRQTKFEIDRLLATGKLTRERH